MGLPADADICHRDCGREGTRGLSKERAKGVGVSEARALGALPECRGRERQVHRPQTVPAKAGQTQGIRLEARRWQVVQMQGRPSSDPGLSLW